MWFAAAFFFLVFQWSVIINVDASRCSSKPIYYASECLEMKECAWCCELPVGRQCLPRRGPESIHSTCSSSAILDYNMTCGELCSTRFNDCGECELKNWCYFCISSSMCQPPYMECPGNSVIQSCDMRRRQPTGNMFYFEVITAVGAALCGAALIASLILVGLRVRQRIREDRPSLTEESVSLLNNGSRAPPHGINQNNYNDRSNNNNNNNNNNSNNRNNSGSNDTARTLATREEVDATVNTFTTAATLHAVSPIRNRENTEVHLTPRSTKVSTGEDEGVCFLCLDASPSVTFLPCYHTCCCEECSNKLRPTRGDVLTCPFCRTKIVSMVSLHSILLQASSKS
ncbi:hypothetical protein LSM04_002620 [Trypanosoma melophagium]|uniref:uncharacterized protein n=1 Tax=Trypanosoma melophagium TaxID=715481 RepID=UPI00351A6E02|nr:hypothetical protein LSM04_002620 [Trypanosoma melophagium]